MEFQDFDAQYYSEDGSLGEDSAVVSWVNTWVGASRDAGRDPHPGPQIAGWMRDAGFQNVKQEKFRLPIGPWAKDKHLVSLSFPAILHVPSSAGGQ